VPRNIGVSIAFLHRRLETRPISRCGAQADLDPFIYPFIEASGLFWRQRINPCNFFHA
jgi:hypothetical protein